MRRYKRACLLVIVLAIVPAFIFNKAEASNYPEKFDLRNCDLDGNGQYKNYVTSTKMQDPYGTCWSHGAICAAETSILSMQHKNSWYVGADGISQSHWGIDDSGYYYLSYFDKSLVNLTAYKFNLKKNDNKIIHQNDFMSREEMFTHEKDAPLKSANVFCANNSEELYELSFMTNKANEEVTYNVYALDSPSQQVDQENLLCSKTESYPYRGFHRVHLDQRYKLNKGQYFAVVVNEKCSGKNIISLAGDYNHEGHEQGKCNDNYWANGVVNPGESYMFDNGWRDFSQVKSEWENKDKCVTYDNFPIKAFADPVPENTNNPAKTADYTFILIFGLMLLAYISYRKFNKNS